MLSFVCGRKLHLYNEKRGLHTFILYTCFLFHLIIVYLQIILPNVSLHENKETHIHINPFDINCAYVMQ